MTAFEVIRYAKALEPRWIVIENVVHMRSWSRYEEWRSALMALGYHLTDQVLNAADFGVPQARKRLFVCADREVKPRLVRPSRARRKCARAILDLNGSYSFSPLYAKGRANATLARARRAIEALGPRKPFLLVYYGSDGAGGWQPLDVPLRTVTTLDRFALVRPKTRGYEMRMLQVGELRKAMGFPAAFVLRRGTRRDRIHLLGNAVCPPVMAAVLRSLTRS
jgi:DNA (cytosine-5)-methyltransferase 1